eukprot:41090-Chlamydomonas_euryale.AAC.2
MARPSWVASPEGGQPPPPHRSHTNPRRLRGQTPEMSRGECHTPPSVRATANCNGNSHPSPRLKKNVALKHPPQTPLSNPKPLNYSLKLLLPLERPKGTHTLQPRVSVTGSTPRSQDQRLGHRINA